MVNNNGESGGQGAGGAGRVISALADALVFFAVLVFSALAVIVIALAAPLAIALSALAGVLSPGHRARRWRDAHAG